MRVSPARPFAATTYTQQTVTHSLAGLAGSPNGILDISYEFAPLDIPGQMLTGVELSFSAYVTASYTIGSGTPAPGGGKGGKGGPNPPPPPPGGSSDVTLQLGMETSVLGYGLGATGGTWSNSVTKRVNTGSATTFGLSASLPVAPTASPPASTPLKARTMSRSHCRRCWANG